MEHGLGPDEYEARTGITKAEYEARALTGARQWAFELFPPGSTAATIESIALEDVDGDASLVVLFRIPARPACLWGHRTPLWPAPLDDDEDTPESAGEWSISFGVDEHVEQGGLVVRECASEGVTWLP